MIKCQITTGPAHGVRFTQEKNLNFVQFELSTELIRLIVNSKDLFWFE